MSIPAARELLAEALKEPVPEDKDVLIEEAIALMYRRAPVTNAPVQSMKVTATIAANIRRYHKNNPYKTQQQIAAAFSTNSGRVSEALRGER